MKPIVALFCISFLSTLALAMYADQIIPPESQLAEQIDAYMDAHPDTYEFVARTTDGLIVVQVRYEDDGVGLEGFLTHTPALEANLDNGQQANGQTLSDAGVNDGSSLDELRVYGYDATGHGHGHEHANTTSHLVARIGCGCTPRMCDRSGNLHKALRSVPQYPTQLHRPRISEMLLHRWGVCLAEVLSTNLIRHDA
ncbi:hypothetical protein P7C73_g76, partial [Tremellales sp. Uapishka_1]